MNNPAHRVKYEFEEHSKPTGVFRRLRVPKGRLKWLGPRPKGGNKALARLNWDKQRFR